MRVVVGEVEVDEDIVAVVDVPVETREEEVLLLEAGRGSGPDGHIAYVEKELNAVGALCRGDTVAGILACRRPGMVRGDRGGRTVGVTVVEMVLVLE